LLGLTWASLCSAAYSKSLVQFALPRFHAVNHQIPPSHVENNELQQGCTRRKPEYPSPRRVIVNDATFDMGVFESKSDVVFGIAVLERRRSNVDAHDCEYRNTKVGPLRKLSIRWAPALPAEIGSSYDWGMTTTLPSGGDRSV
jgi:hypothetical protein